MSSSAIFVWRFMSVEIIAYVGLCSALLNWLYWLVVLLFYVHGKHLRSCRDGQLT